MAYRESVAKPATLAITPPMHSVAVVPPLTITTLLLPVAKLDVLPEAVTMPPRASG